MNNIKEVVYQLIKYRMEKFGVSLNEQQMKDVASLFSEKKYKKGDFIIQAGDNFNLVGFVQKGLVRSYYNSFDGKEFNHEFRKENEIILSYYPLYTSSPSPFNIQALEDTIIAQADYKEFALFYEKDQMWDRLGRKLLEESFMLKSQREAQLLLFDTLDRYNNFLIEEPELSKRLPQQHIAFYLGVNPSTLNRLIKSQKS